MDEKEAEARPVMGTIFLVLLFVTSLLLIVCLLRVPVDFVQNGENAIFHFNCTLAEAYD